MLLLSLASLLWRKLCGEDVCAKRSHHSLTLSLIVLVWDMEKRHEIVSSLRRRLLFFPPGLHVLLSWVDEGEGAFASEATSSSVLCVGPHRSFLEEKDGEQEEEDEDEELCTYVCIMPVV